MSDQFGAMTLPAAAGKLDPALGVLLDFARAVLLAELQAGWAGTDGAEPRGLVNLITAADPARGGVLDDKLPGLFAWRRKGDLEELAGGLVRHEGEIVLAWLWPPAKAKRRSLQDSVAVALGKALASALSDGRHPAWTHAEDAAVPQAIKLAAAAPLANITYSGTDLDGPVGANAFPAPRRVLLTLGTGNWDTSKAITIYGPLTDGTPWEEQVYPTNPTGPEELETSWIFTQVDAVDVPEQPSALGTLAIGTASASGGLGSLIETHLGGEVRCAGWQREDVQIGVNGGPALRYPAVLVRVHLCETRLRDGSALGYESWGAVGMTGQIISINGITIETENE